MYANLQSNRLNTIALRGSYIFPILKRPPWRKPRKTGEVVYLPTEITKTETRLPVLVLE